MLLKYKIISLLLLIMLLGACKDNELLWNKEPVITDYQVIENGYPGVSYEFIITAFDPNNDDVYFNIQWGDDTEETQTEYVHSGSIQIFKHIWLNPGTYTVTITVYDPYTHYDSVDYDILIQKNTPPSIVQFDGEEEVFPRLSYLYTIRGDDPEEEVLAYQLNWADFYFSHSTNYTNTIASFYHKWENPGIYKIQLTIGDGVYSVSEEKQVIVLDKWNDGFENPNNTEWKLPFSELAVQPLFSDINPKSGTYGIYLTPALPATLLYYTLPQNDYKSISIWFYDYFPLVSEEEVCFAMLYSTFGGAILGAGVTSIISLTTYSVLFNITKEEYDTEIPRTTGWHKITFERTSIDIINITFDDNENKAVTLTGMPEYFLYFCFGSGWDGDINGQAINVNASFCAFDEFEIVF